MNIEEIKKRVIVEDGHILIDQPLQYVKYGKRIIVKQLNYFYEWGTFSYILGCLLEKYYIMSKVSILPDNIDKIETFRNTFKRVLADKQVFALLEKICCYALFQFKIFGKWYNVHFGKLNNIKWMRKQFTIDDYLELFTYIYLYNIQGQKKNFRDALRVMEKVA